MNRLVACLLVLATTVLAADSPQVSREYELKAAFVANVTKFVEWPAPSDQGPMTVAVLGAAAGAVVTSTLTGMTLMKRPVVVQTYSRARDIKPCTVLFVTAEAAGEQSGAFRAAEGQPVLTITEVAEPTTPPAIVTLLIVDTKLTFHVNLDAARANRIRVSSNLLKLARTVTGAGASGAP